MTTNINNKYMIDDIISKGGFGIVFKGHKIKNNQSIAVKINYDKHNALKQESTILHYLNNKKCNNIPTIFYYGIWENNPVMVIPYYECSLNDFIVNHNTYNIIKNLFYQSLQIMKNIHDHYIIHCDIKPDNIMVYNNKVIFIDFGLANFYKSDDGFLPNIDNDSITGSPLYVSHFIHQGNTPSIRDDLISLCFVFLKYHLKYLPWNLPTDYSHSLYNPCHKMFVEKKSAFPYNCNIDYITSVLKYCYLLDYDQMIDYELIIN
uniref:non-specific serine/threonine protein kinase n=1 Tax=viral metagenome TaxID=1070528 RepID=A0A6C0C1D7_9ZZZZ